MRIEDCVLGKRGTQLTVGELISCLNSLVALDPSFADNHITMDDEYGVSWSLETVATWHKDPDNLQTSWIE